MLLRPQVPKAALVFARRQPQTGATAGRRRSSRRPRQLHWRRRRHGLQRRRPPPMPSKAMATTRALICLENEDEPRQVRTVHRVRPAVLRRLQRGRDDGPDRELSDLPGSVSRPGRGQGRAAQEAARSGSRMAHARGAVQPWSDVQEWHWGPAGSRRGCAVVPARRRPGGRRSAVSPWDDVRVWQGGPAGPRRGRAVVPARRRPGERRSGSYTAIALMYKDGTGVPQDHTEAARWYRLAAD